jgi:hypothetical protein
VPLAVGAMPFFCRVDVAAKVVSLAKKPERDTMPLKKFIAYAKTRGGHCRLVDQPYRCGAGPEAVPSQANKSGANASCCCAALPSPSPRAPRESHRPPRRQFLLRDRA